MTDPDLNDLAVWFPPLEAVGVPVPRTQIVTTDAPLMNLLDGEEVEGWETFIGVLAMARAVIGEPCFLRTGHGSGKHEWRECCYVERGADLQHHVAALVEWSALSDLPARTWAVRELIPTVPMFICEGYAGFPVTREFRVFIRGDSVEHVQPYWPPDSVEQGRPDDPDWRERLKRESQLNVGEAEELAFLAGMASGAQDGEHYWSVDCLQDRDGKWWVTDMARGDDSFRWEP